MKGEFILHVLVSPVEIWEILTEWGQRIQAARQKLRIWSTGTACLGNPAINAIWEAIEAKVENSSIWGDAEWFRSKEVVAEIPSPTYGYMRGGVG